MKSFKMIAMVTLVFAAAVQSAFAVGRITDVEEINKDHFMCDRITAQQLKPNTASVKLRESDRKIDSEEATSVRSSM